MDYASWSDEHLVKVSIKNGTHIMGIWCSEPSDKPLLLLVHGISGDHIGLLPLAEELAKTYRIAMLDLPGHGASDIIPLSDAVALQRWFDTVLALIEHEIGSVAAVCAHSFGCSAVLSVKNVAYKKIILLNPVPTPSGMYANYSRVIMNSAHFWAHIYNWPLFVWLRGITLAKLRTREAMRRIRWVGWHSRATYDQIVFQAGLVDMILDGSAYGNASNGGALLVVCGMFDTTAHQRDSIDMQEIFGDSKVVFLRGGHLLPIESPERVANLIMDVVVH